MTATRPSPPPPPRRPMRPRSRTSSRRRSARSATTSTTGCATTSARTPEMLAYLNAENAYADAVMAPLKPLREQAVRGDRRPHQAGRQLGAVPRARLLVLHAASRPARTIRSTRAARARMDAPEEVLLDVNAMAKGKDYFSVGDWEVSQDNQMLAWADDAVGRRQYTIRFKNLATGEVYADEITGVSPNLVWADDNRTLFYVENDPETLLTVRVKKHVLGTPAVAGRAGVRGEGRQLLHGHRPHAATTSSSASAWRARCRARCAARRPPIPAEFAVLAPRERDVEYQRRPPRRPLGDPHQRRRREELQARDRAERRRPRASSGRTGCRTATTSSSKASSCSTASPPIAERSDGLERLRLLQDGRQGGVRQGRRAGVLDGPVGQLRARHAVAALQLHLADHAGHHVRAQRRHRRAQAAQARAGARLRPGRSTSPSACGRPRATASKVPVSLVYRKGFEKNGKAALLQYAYGSYGTLDRPALQRPGGEPARPRHGLRHRPHPRRPGDGPQVVRRRQAVQQEEHLHRLHRRHRLPGEAGLRREGPRRRLRRQRRRPADGRDRQHGAGPTTA